LAVVDPLLIIIYELNLGVVNYSAEELELVIRHTQVAALAVRSFGTLASKDADMRVTAAYYEAKTEMSH
jgi:hypothetical protein